MIDQWLVHHKFHLAGLFIMAMTSSRLWGLLSKSHGAENVRLQNNGLDHHLIPNIDLYGLKVNLHIVSF